MYLQCFVSRRQRTTQTRYVIQNILNIKKNYTMEIKTKKEESQIFMTDCKFVF